MDLETILILIHSICDKSALSPRHHTDAPKLKKKNPRQRGLNFDLKRPECVPLVGAKRDIPATFCLLVIVSLIDPYGNKLTDMSHSCGRFV